MITTIDGMAGAGKTALVVHWAHRVAHRFGDGRLYVNLRGYDRGAPVRPMDALGQLLNALGIPPEQLPATIDQAAALYRSRLAGRRMLVVLDNARSVAQVRPLLPGSPGCLVLIASRNRLTGLLAREGASRVTLGMLDSGAAHRLLELVIGEDRVRAEPMASAELAALCGYLPLALRIAAADLTGGRRRRVADQVAKLRDGDRLAALSVGGDEQVAMRASLDLSYRDLTPLAQRLFRLLALTPGTDVTADAAAVLAKLDPAEAASTLDRLASAHLLEEYASGRFRCHELVRDYAAECTAREDAADERTHAVHRLLDWYLRHAGAATRIIRPHTRLQVPGRDTGAMFAGPAQAARWLAAERGNLVAAMHYAAEHGLHRVA